MYYSPYPCNDTCKSSAAATLLPWLLTLQTGPWPVPVKKTTCIGQFYRQCTYCQLCNCCMRNQTVSITNAITTSSLTLSLSSSCPSHHPPLSRLHLVLLLTLLSAPPLWIKNVCPAELVALQMPEQQMGPGRQLQSSARPSWLATARPCAFVKKAKLIKILWNNSSRIMLFAACKWLSACLLKCRFCSPLQLAKSIRDLPDLKQILHAP